ncbi:unnamed protein product [Phytophthora fragariaefolia]|uniref:Unnamed protein product n=1 Tax=Phytophthora fragariaefolia TaxID=1490495 RepID=A0A9W6XL58_9STRA|nr:unnamed protein product [Phytophthora fragariaefolia]
MAGSQWLTQLPLSLLPPGSTLPGFHRVTGPSTLGCVVSSKRWPELSQVQPSELREITLRVSGPVAPSLAPVSLPLSSAASSTSSSVPRSGSAASAAPATSSAGLVSSMVVTSAPESTARPLPAVSVVLVSSVPPSTRRTSPQATKASAGSTSKSARKAPTKDDAGPSRRAPRNSASSPKLTSAVAPAPSITGSARSQRASALNARAINSLELQALEASDAEGLGWLSGAANSAARATSASSPLVVDSPTPVGTSSRHRQSSSDDSDDDEVALQRSRRLRKKSVVESDESSDSVAEALEEKPASPLTPASVSPGSVNRPEALVFAGDSSFDQEGACKCLSQVVKPAASGRQVSEQSSSDCQVMQGGQVGDQDG